MLWHELLLRRHQRARVVHYVSVRFCYSKREDTDIPSYYIVNIDFVPHSKVALHNSDESVHGFDTCFIQISVIGRNGDDRGGGGRWWSM